jgi:hypothetical protein
VESAQLLADPRRISGGSSIIAMRSSTFGAISSAHDPRNIQPGMKLIF